MVEVILDATQLDYLQTCPRKWFFNFPSNLEPKHTNPALLKGSFWHEILAHYYTNLRTKATGLLLKECQELMYDSERLQKYKIRTVEARDFHIKRFVAYVYKNYAMDEKLEPVAVEQGFSNLLYEDDNYRFILEGKIDLVAFHPNYGILVIDHKTQSRSTSIYFHNNQVMNYFRAIKPNYFMYNYIGFQDKINDNTFNREIYQPHSGMIEQWEEDIKLTFMELSHYMSEGKLKESNYPRRHKNCQTQYGVCAYNKLCSVPDRNDRLRLIVLSHYKPKEREWRAWG